MEEIIRLEHVCRDFGGNRVVEDISFSCSASEIKGLVGRNGSGKTVLFKCICGLIPVTEGKIFIHGKQVGKEIDIPDNIGVLIENPAFLAEFSAYDNLRILADINKKIGAEEIKEILEQFGLNPKDKKKVGKFSMGMRQRLGLAQAFMEKPDILILDEPMNGLDVHWLEQTRNLLLEQKKQGKTILLASHNREDIEFLCDDIIRLVDGRMSEE